MARDHFVERLFDQLVDEIVAFTPRPLRPETSM